MRRSRARSIFLALLLTIAVFGTARGDGEAAEAAADDDLDLEDLEDESAAPGEGVGPDGSPVEDFDLGMPEEDRKKRMSACYVHTINRAQHRRTELQQTAEQVVKQHGGPEMTPDKAINSIVFSWMMSCYMNIDASGMKEAIVGKAPTQELEQELFAPREDRPQQVPQASRRQWSLLEQVLTEMTKEQAEQQKQQQQQQKSSSSSSGRTGAGGAPAPQPPAYTGGGPLLSGLSGQSQAIYVLVVFGVIFGVSILGVMRLMKSEQEGRSSKNRKAEKAEKKASRKGK